VGERRNIKDRGVEEKLNEFAAFLEGKELSQNTIAAYTTSMKQFFESHADISKKNALAWKREMQERGLSPKTINIRLNAYNTYCAMLGNNADSVKTMRVHQASAVSNVISEADYKKLLSGLAEDKNWRWYFGVKLLAMTGARISEYIRLKKSDFDRGYAEMWTKGKNRRIYIPDSFRKEAAEHYSDLESSDYLIRNRYGGQFTSRGVAEALQSLAERHDIDKKVMHPHSFRHLFAIEFLQRNSNLSLLADVMGHSSVSTTAIYTRMTQEQQISAVNNAVNW